MSADGPMSLDPRRDALGAPSCVRSGRNPQEVAAQFEALLLKGLVEAMRTTTMAEDESGGQLVAHLIDDALSGHLARSGGIGLASLVDDQVAEPHVVASTERQLELERWVRGGLTAPAPAEVTDGPGDKLNDINPNVD